MVPNLNCECHEILIDLSVLYLYLQVDAFTSLEMLSNFMPDWCLKQSDGCLQFNFRWIYFRLFDMIAE